MKPANSEPVPFAFVSTTSTVPPGVPGGVRQVSWVLLSTLTELAATPPAAVPSPAPPPPRPALDGVRVLDLCIVLAGPSAGRTLAEFGADVVKIDPPDREGRAHEDVNRGKRSILLDLTTPAGLEVFWQLVDWADVVAQNIRPGVAERLGVGYESVRARKPAIVYLSIDTYGPGGGYYGRRGWDPTAAAFQVPLRPFWQSCSTFAPDSSSRHCQTLRRDRQSAQQHFEIHYLAGTVVTAAALFQFQMTEWMSGCCG